MSDRIHGPIIPNAPLAKGEEVIHSFAPCPEVFRRQHMRHALVAMLIGIGFLWLLHNPHFWAGALFGLAGFMAYIWALARRELTQRWDLTDRRLLGPDRREIALSEIARICTRGTAVHVLTRDGARHVLKYQPNRDTTRLMIRAVMNGMRE